MANETGRSVTWQVVAMALFGVLVAVLGYLHTEAMDDIDTLQKRSEAQQETISTIRSDIVVIKDRSARNEKDVEEIKQRVEQIHHLLLQAVRGTPTP